MSYDVRTVVRITGISRSTLLAWERRHRLVSPDRLPNGYRSYSDKDVQLLRTVKSLVDGGHRIGEAVRMVSVGGETSVPSGTASGWGVHVESLIDAFANLDDMAADRILAMLVDQPLSVRLSHLFEPLVLRVEALPSGPAASFGRTWLSGRLGAWRVALSNHGAGSRTVLFAGLDSKVDLWVQIRAIQEALGGSRVVVVSSGSSRNLVQRSAERVGADQVVWVGPRGTVVRRLVQGAGR